MTDEGPGFPDEHVNKAFDRFTHAETGPHHRGHRPRTKSGPGSRRSHHGTAAITGKATVTVTLLNQALSA